MKLLSWQAHRERAINILSGSHHRRQTCLGYRQSHGEMGLFTQRLEHTKLHCGEGERKHLAQGIPPKGVNEVTWEQSSHGRIVSESQVFT